MASKNKIETVCKYENGQLVPLNIYASEYLSQELQQGDLVMVTCKVQSRSKMITCLQRNCKWLYCGEMAKALNEHGFDMRKFFEVVKPGFQVPWSKESFADYVWRPMQEALADNTGTNEQRSAEVQEVYKHVDARISELSGGVQREWPSKQRMRQDQTFKAA